MSSLAGGLRPDEVWPTGATLGAGIIGSPVRHSLSPVLHNAAFASVGLDWAYLAFDVAPGSGAKAIEGAKALGLRGLSVTMPHKADAAAAVDRLGPCADRLGGVNTVVFVDDGTYGESTDGAGFLAGVREAAGFVPASSKCVVVGAGGAGRAVVLALAEAGAAEVSVVNRTPERALAAAALAGPDVGRVVAGAAVAAAVGGADLIVNATPLGMGMPAGAADTASRDDAADGWRAGGDRLPLDPAQIRPGQIVVDLVYHPTETPFLREAAKRGARTVNGLPMLVHQAARQFEMWTGLAAPVGAMRAALEAKLAETGR